MDGTARTGMGLTRVEALTSNNEYREYTEQQDIEKAYLIENEKRFTQSKSIHCMTYSLAEELGLLSTGRIADAILEGQYTIPGAADSGLQTVFDNLKRHDGIPLQRQATPITCD